MTQYFILEYYGLGEDDTDIILSDKDAKVLLFDNQVIANLYLISNREELIKAYEYNEDMDRIEVRECVLIK